MVLTIFDHDYTKCFKKFDIIWDAQGVSEKMVSFCNLITWPILI